MNAAHAKVADSKDFWWYVSKILVLGIMALFAAMISFGCYFFAGWVVGVGQRFDLVLDLVSVLLITFTGALTLIFAYDHWS